MTYYKLQGTYWDANKNAISDPTTLNKLMSGALPSTSVSSFDQIGGSSAPAPTPTPSTSSGSGFSSSGSSGNTSTPVASDTYKYLGADKWQASDGSVKTADELYALGVTTARTDGHRIGQVISGVPTAAPAQTGTSTPATSSGTSSSTSTPTLGDGYYKVQNTYWKKTGTGVMAVSDPATLNQLMSGQVASKPAEYADLFSSQITSTPTPGETTIFNSDEFKNLPADQQAALTSIFTTISTNDANAKAKIQNAYTEATKQADPYFKTQIKLALDQLDRGFSDTNNDLEYQEKSLSNNLNDLKETLSRSNTNLTLDQQAELHTLARNFEEQLGTTRQQLADSGLTQSSRRVKAESILNDTNAGLVESTNRKFGEQFAQNTQQQSIAERDTAAQIEQLTKAATSKKLDMGRTAEAAVGSKNLPSLPGYNPMGDVVGSIPQNEQSDIDKAAAILYNNGFVF